MGIKGVKGIRNIFLLFLLFVSFYSIAGNAGPANQGEKLDPGGAIGPQYNPKTDPNSTQYDPDYNPASDPNHPLKDKSKDPGAPWENHRLSDGTPPVNVSKGGWDWGELFFENSYQSKLTVTNGCKGTQTVSIFINNLPYLSMPNSLTIPGNSQIDVELTIDTPPQPPPPLLTGAPGQPTSWGWVQPPPPQPFGAPRFHQPNFVDVQGEVIIWHPWNGNCFPKRETYNATGHIHFKPPGPPPSGPEKLATPSVCQVYWNIGVPPAQLDDKDCTEEFRKLATQYREKILGPYVDREPEKWNWLPDASDIRNMSESELLAMKARADVLMLEVL